MSRIQYSHTTTTLYTPVTTPTNTTPHNQPQP